MSYSQTYSQRYYKKNKAKVLRERARYRRENFDKVRDSKMRHQYGISLEEYETRIIQQDGVCMICRLAETQIHPKTKRPKALTVDHNHKTGQVRDLLCTRCNSVLGYVGEDALLLRALASYIEKHRGLH